MNQHPFLSLWSCLALAGALCTPVSLAQTSAAAPTALPLAASVGLEPSSVATPSARPLVLKTGFISGGLSVSLSQAGVPDAVALTLVRELSQAFNVDESVSANDTFSVLFETALLPSTSTIPTGATSGGGGAVATPPQLIAFEYTHLGKLYAAYWFDVSNSLGDEGFFLEDGSSLRPSFLRTPIEIVRMTSGFGARKVPRRKAWRNHDGIDFGAPIGTRIFAAADGKIEVMRMERGFGKVVKLSHAKNASTIYAHMSAFVAGLTVGSEVKQGEVIGFVGRTGWATGPHLHYEYRVDNKPVDPFSNDFPTSQSVPAERMPAFNAQVAAMRARFGLMKRARLNSAPPAVQPSE